MELASVPLQRTDTGILANSTTKVLHNVVQWGSPKDEAAIMIRRNDPRHKL